MTEGRLNSPRLLVQIGLRYLYGIVTTGVGVLFTLLTYGGALSQNAAVWLSLAYLLLLLVTLWLVQYKASSHVETVRQANERANEEARRRAAVEAERRRLQDEATAASSGLIAGSLEELCEAMRVRLWKLDEVNRRIQQIVTGALKLAPRAVLREFDGGPCDERNITEDLLAATLARLCEVFERDSYAQTRTKYGASVFKATLFVPRTIDGKIVLERDAYKYPGGLAPKTRRIDLDEHPRAAAVLCYRNVEMVVLQDIEGERSQNGNARWADFYTGQHQNYKSMVCTYIAKGAPKSPEREILAVLTIDTNRIGYFREEDEWKQLLAAVLKPFRIYIALLYEVRRSHELMLEGLRHQEQAVQP